MEQTWNPETNPQAKLRTIDENTDTHLHALGFANDSLNMRTSVTEMKMVLGMKKRR